VATEIVVDPTRAGTNWRAPKWLAEKTANDRACDSSNGTRDQQTGACSRSGADHVSASSWRNRRDRDDRRDCKYNLAHLLSLRPSAVKADQPHCAELYL
jgi:hypothetical protein